MSIEIRGISPGFNPTRMSADPRAGSPGAAGSAGPAGEPARDIQRPIEELETLSWAFNRRLKFTINHDLDRVVVKVIDGETDKVIKELPPEALQRVHARIREAIGLLLDEEI